MSSKAETEAPPAPVDPTAAPQKQDETPAAPALSESADIAPLEKKTEELAISVDDAKTPERAQEKAEETTAAVAVSPTPALTSPAETAAAAPTLPSEPAWPETGPEHPLTKFCEALPSLLTEAGHAEVYGVNLTPEAPFHTRLILQKFLRANSNDLTKAKQQLLDTLKWRKEFDPVGAASASYEKERFEGLGYVMELQGVPDSANESDVVTFNIYGAVKDNKKTFGDLEGFLRWRVGLMERSVQKLNLSKATRPIPDFGQGPDPYQGYQVHDYLHVSFIRQDPAVKAATKRTIETLSHYYPETLSRKFFVNVPVVMGWIYQAMKLLVAKETAKKFTVLSYGNELAAELGPKTPKEYGGGAAALNEVGEAMNFAA